MYTYFAYGLVIESDIPLPEFVEAQTSIHHVSIRTAHITDLPAKYERNSTYLVVGEQETVLSIQADGIFWIRNGSEIIVIPANWGDIDRLTPIISGTVLALLLLQRGFLVLHASAVSVGGQVVAFMGESGSGKSSFAAALHARGHTIIADDVTAIQLGSTTAKVVPGFPQMKISLEAARSLGLNTKTLINLSGEEEKRGFRFATRFTRIPLPLSHTYVLSSNTNQSYERLVSKEAVVELVRNTYPTRFAHAGGAKHFIKCVELARKAPMFYVTRPQSLDILPDFAAQLERHIYQLRQG